jgi:hypothetical protein
MRSLIILFILASCASSSHLDSHPSGARRTARPMPQQMEEKKALVEACAAIAEAQHENVSGKLVLRFKMEKSGRVSELEILENSIMAPGLPSCIQDAFKKSYFDPAPNVSIVTYPYKIKSSQ